MNNSESKQESFNTKTVSNLYGSTKGRIPQGANDAHFDVHLEEQEHVYVWGQAQGCISVTLLQPEYRHGIIVYKPSQHTYSDENGNYMFIAEKNVCNMPYRVISGIGRQHTANYRGKRRRKK